MDKCSKCGCSTTISKAHIEFEGDTSPNLKTVAYNVLDIVCTNSRCDNYTQDLSNPKIILETIRQPMN